MRVRDGVLDGCDFSKLSAVRFVYRYVIKLKVRFENKNAAALQSEGIDYLLPRQK